MVKVKIFREFHNTFLLLASILCFVLAAHSALAEDSACARVKIEVAQELTLERQAFDAHMRINNGLDLISLENVNVDVTFLDKDGRTVRASSDPDDTTALFFIRLNSLEQINRVDGLGSVAPKTSADIHWLIIPAPGASKGVEAGTLYYVGATLAYTIGGERHSTTVTPDHIFVKPMPQMVLDYFLPGDVYGDDPLTPETEPPVPFSLGLRVRNNGTGTARNVKIDSAQPRIVDNAQGLPIDFTISGSEVNGNAAAKTLLATFGNILPSSSGIARWIMTCSLTGTFVAFNAEFSHADELGGELTSLIDSVNTHILVRDVLVDLPGRDAIRDFLAKDGGVLRVYESQGVDTVVLDQSSSSRLQPSEQVGSLTTHSLSTSPTAGFMLVQLTDPNGGRKVLKEVLRSDGKRIKPDNCWLTSKRTGSQTLQHSLNLFDANSTGAYTVVFDDPSFQSKPPVIDSVSDQTGVEGQPLAFNVTASDPDGTIPALSASPLPARAQFSDLGSGTGVFAWTPAVGQAGVYPITITASDGALKTTRRASLTICSAGDSDCDGLADTWELVRFGSLDRDGKGDLDGDGVSDFDEYWRGTDPTRSNAPTIPVIVSPQDKEEVTVPSPELMVQSGIDPDTTDRVTHVFEIYGEPGMVNRIASAEGLFGAGATTSWTVPIDLEENGHYFWRVRATDGRNFSQWAYGSFLVNTANDAPSACIVSSPRSGSEVDTLTPRLQIVNSLDPDGDCLTYGFEVYADEDLSTLVASQLGISEGQDGITSWTVPAPLANHRAYFLRATVTDEHGARAAAPLTAFAVNVANAVPTMPGIVFPAPDAELDSRDVELVCANSVDADGDPLAYTFEIDTVRTFDGPELTVSESIGEGVSVSRWSVNNLADNTEYFWRVRAGDGSAWSPWAQGAFFVNTANDPPSTPTVKNPGDGAWVQTLTPMLQLNPATDADRDRLFYRFEVGLDDGLQELVAAGETDAPEWTVPIELADNSRFFWRGQARDEHGARSPWTPVVSFFVNNNGVDDPPRLVLKEPATDVITNGDLLTITWTDDDADSNADVSLTFNKDMSSPSGTTIASGIKEDDDGPNGSYVWDISGVPEGTYWIQGTITDAGSSRASTAPGKVVIDRTAPTVQASPKGSTFGEPQRVTLTASEPATIHCTLDGTEPTTSSPICSAPVTIDATTTLRFMAMDPAGNESSVSVETYTILPGDTLHHFAIETPGNAQSGLGFSLTIRALSASNAVVEDFSERVSLSASAGTIAPTATSEFTKGVWKGTAAISGTTGPVRLTVAWNGFTGTSQPIQIECRPPQAPILDRPRDGSRVTSDGITFTWHPVPGALSYSFELADNPGFANSLFAEDATTSTSFTPPETVFDDLDSRRVYFWRVRAANGCSAGAFSEPRRFVYIQTRRPGITLLSPENGATLPGGSPYTIRWYSFGRVGSTLRITLKAPGAPSRVLAASVPADSNTFAWNVPPGALKRCRILIESEQFPRIRALSGLFSIR